MQLLATKLFNPLLRPDPSIPLRPRFVPRQRLIERLDHGLDAGHKLTLVSAPAGFGKTTLVAEWLSQTDRPSAWLSLDGGDNDPVRFLAYLLAAQQQIDPAIGTAAQAVLQAPQPANHELLLTSLINDIANALRPFVFLLDDYHVIVNPVIHDLLSYLLDHLPPQMHLVLVTRADPPLPIPRLRGRGQLSELYQSDLRFTSEEVAQFLDLAAGLRLSPEDSAALERRTEGWIAGLQMAAISMRGRDDVSAYVHAFAGSHRYVFDYLGEEVFRQQTADVQAFLLHTAILDRLCGELCDAVINARCRPEGGQSVDSQSILEQLEHDNLFIVALDERRHWYRYHRLFSDLLRQRLQRERSEMIPRLHRRASEWHEENGLIPEAVNHSLAAGDLERAAGLIEWNAWDTLLRGEAATLLAWLAELPEGLTRSRPLLGVLFAWGLAFTRELDAVEPHLQRIDVQDVPGEVAAVRAFVASQRGDGSRAIELCHQAFEDVPQEKWFSRGIASIILGLVRLDTGDPATAVETLTQVARSNRAAGQTVLTLLTTAMLGEALRTQGRLSQAAETYRQVLQLAVEQVDRPAPFVSSAHVGLAWILYEWNDLDGAARHALKGIALGRLGGLIDAMQGGYLVLAQVHQAQGEGDLARQMINEAQRFARSDDPFAVARMAAQRAKLWRIQKDTAAASHWMQSHAPGLGEGTDYAREFYHVALVRSLLAQAFPYDERAASQVTPSQTEHINRAQDLLLGLLDAAEAAGRTGSVILMLTLQTMALQAAGAEEQALETLGRALSLAETETYVRTFADEGEAMARLLDRALTQRIAPNYVSTLLAAFGETAEPSPAVTQQLIEPLTERELEVLCLIAAGLSNGEIARELVVAVSTVKSHVNHIFGKLEVKSRTQAVARADKLGLL